MPSLLFLSLMNSHSWGGSEEQWFAFAQSLLQEGYDVGIACFEWPGKKEKLLPLINAGATLYFMPGKKQTKKNIFGKWRLWRTLQTIPFQHYDLVYVNQGGWKDLTHSPFRNFFKKLPPYIISFHNYNAGATLSRKKIKSLAAWTSGAKFNLTPAQKAFKVIEKDFDIMIPRKIFYDNPIAFAPPAEATPYPDLKDGNYHLCMLAALDIIRKAQDVLIETLAMSKWKERNWILHFYGEGEDREKLENLISKNQLSHKIFLKGHTHNVQAVLAWHHLVLQCTHIDAMPISISEAMAMARPCVVSNVGDMPLWVQDGVNGFVCDKATMKEIDQVLEKCWERRRDWPEMGRKSFEIFSNRYPQPYAEKFLELIRE